MNDELTRKQYLKKLIRYKYNWFQDNLSILNLVTKLKKNNEIYSDNSILENFNNENINKTQLAAKSTPTKQSVYSLENNKYNFKGTEKYYSNNNSASNIKKQNENISPPSAKLTPTTDPQFIYYWVDQVDVDEVDVFQSKCTSENPILQEEANADIFNFQCTSTNVKKSNNNNNFNLLLNAIDSLEERYRD